MTRSLLFCGWKPLLLAFGVAVLAFPALANEKAGMPDLSQEEQTCLPTSTANLIVWFGTHGYPKLIVAGDDKNDGYIHTVHRIITATGARYDWGTRTDAVAYGIAKYIHEAGYDCDVEYRGLDWNQVKFPDVVKDVEGEKYKAYQKTPAAFSQDWLQQNDDPNKGFILLLSYCMFNRTTNVFTNAINAGHAVTLVNAEPDLILIHDPAHENDETGRKILTPTPLSGGVYLLPGYNAPVAGLMLLSGTLLDSPPDSQVLLTGAVCVTMHPPTVPTDSVIASAGASPSNIGAKDAGSSSSAPVKPSTTTPMSTSTSWVAWLFDLFFKK